MNSGISKEFHSICIPIFLLESIFQSRSFKSYKKCEPLFLSQTRSSKATRLKINYRMNRL
ncbi:hypothetical protein CH365_05060 [Leptospira neocaledonica]|uniref:Uncharacterized protein n=1 Tax=Leptospira neocaledonica TaxID=2023192 RepID=A0A2N0A0I2_9LEPT|nr:hypothetical protein CH365_05060 [Leptospira neocaledonica]